MTFTGWKNFWQNFMMSKVHQKIKRIWQHTLIQNIIAYNFISLRYLFAPASPAPIHKPCEHWRSDIDGLRAIAVLAVVFYHAFPKKIQGGFVGVDVFFVISGYLISRIILIALDDGTFSFVDFYTRRIRRIFPALFLVLSVSGLIGYYFLLPPELMPLGLNMLGGAFFFSNFVSWTALGGYFKPDGDLTPLLHLWSLGIEEQFYLLWPWLLVVRKKFALNLLTLLCALFGMSFYFNITNVHTNPDFTFYWPHTRFWELIAGALLAYGAVYKTFVVARVAELYQKFRAYQPALKRLAISTQNFIAHLIFATPTLRPLKLITPAQWRDGFSIIGTLFLAFSIFRIKSSYAFPGFWALLPVAGSFMLLAAGPSALINRTLLSSRIMVFIGTISYPLYLWHWPLLSFSKILITDHPSTLWLLSVLATSMLLAWLTTITLEKRIRFGAWRLQKAASIFASIALCGLVGGWFYFYQGLVKRHVVSIEHPRMDRVLDNYKFFSLNRKNDFELFSNPCEFSIFSVKLFIENKCINYSHDKKNIFFIGDSFFAYFYPALKQNLLHDNYNLIPLFSFTCPPLLTIKSYKKDNFFCKDVNDYKIENLEELKPDMTIIFGSYQVWLNYSDYLTSSLKEPIFYIDNFIENLKRLQNSGLKNIVVIGQMPMWNELPLVVKKEFYLKNLPIPDYTTTGLYTASLKLDTELKQRIEPLGITYISLKDLLCNAHGCMTRVGDNLETDLIAFDYGHLTKAGADYVAQKAVIPLIEQVLSQKGRLAPTAPVK